MEISIREWPTKNAMPMKFAADNLSFLLSSDWFFSVWSLCGLESSEFVQSDVQKGCRAIVESIGKGCETYWEAEFSEARGLRTKTELIHVLEYAKMSHDDQLICKRYLDSVDETTEPEANWALIETLCSLLVSEHGRGERVLDDFGQKAISSIEMALDETSSEQLLVEAGSHAVTRWDHWLLQLTPDLPMFTIDTARELARRAGSHRRLLARLRADLSQNELARLGDWLSKAAAELAGVTLSTTILNFEEG